MLYLEVIPGDTRRGVESNDREGKVDRAALCWEPVENMLFSHFPLGQGRWVFIHQLLPVTGHGLPAQYLQLCMEGT